ncbi:MAG: hypothetical protein BGO49_21510 [Planctomycetales bacterium 71-10]|nr:MAG: hypothetical protein BGO49_21510 [Planctomycetales bacterium 71-10]
MATIGTIRIGMSTDTAGLSKGLKGASSQLHEFTTKIEGVSGLVKGLFAGLAAGGAAMAIKEMAGQAAHLEESFNKIDAVFGDSAGGVAQQARDMAQAFGISVTEMSDAAGRMGSMFTGAGFDQSSAADYSNVMTRLANDLSRFNDTSFETAFDKLRSGLSGESEPLRDFGIFLTEDLVKTRALAMGLGDLNGTLSESEKIQARANLILEQAGPAIGAAAREADGASAKMEALAGRWENLTTTIGQQFAPVVGDAMGGLATTIQVLGGWWDDLSAKINAWGGSTLESLGLAGQGVNALEVAIGGLANGFQLVGVAFHGLQALILAGVTGIVDVMAQAVSAFDSASEALTGWSTGVGETLTTMADSLKSDLSKAKGALIDEWNQPWASEAVSKDFQKVRDENEKLRRELAAKPMTLPIVPKPVDAGQALVDKAAGPPGLAEARRSSSEPKFAGAMLAGSKDAASTILRSRYGGDGNKDAAATAKNTAATADGIKNLPEKIGNALGTALANAAAGGGLDWN